jgi:hypothetical protein
MKRTFLAALVMFASFAAMATPGGEGNNTGCNGVGNANSPCTGTGNGGAVGNGGQGGAGGKATALAAAQARAEARASAIAAQQQAQTQTSRNTNKNSNTVKTNISNTNTVTGGPVNVSVSLPAGTTSTEKSGTPADTVKEMPAAQKSDTVIVDNENTRYPVSTAYAAPLTASNGTCMGSSSAGAQGAALGVSFGTTWTDTSCDIRYDAEALRAANMPRAAIARLCQKAEIAKAMEAAGTPCPRSDAKRAESILNGEAVTQRQAMPWQAGG